MIYDKPIRQYVWYIYFANILYNIFAIPICKCNSNMFSVWTILYCKYIEQYICNILSVSIKMDKWQPYTTIYLQYLCKCIGQYICSKYIVFNIKYFYIAKYCLRQTRWISQKPISNIYYCVLQIYWTIYLQYTIFHIANNVTNLLNNIFAIHDIVYCKYIRQHKYRQYILAKKQYLTIVLKKPDPAPYTCLATLNWPPCFNLLSPINPLSVLLSPNDPFKNNSLVTNFRQSLTEWHRWRKRGGGRTVAPPLFRLGGHGPSPFLTICSK